MRVAMAGNEVGNGGDVIVCPNKAPVLLDFHENKNKKMPYTLLTKKGKDELEYLKEVLGNLSGVSQSFHKKYLNDLTQLKGKLVYLPDTKFRDVKDSFHVGVPKGCEIKQAAIQKEGPQGTIIYINKDLYEKMSVEQRAGLLGHEMIYEHFKYFGQQHSVNVRELNRYFFSKEMPKKGSASFVKLVQGMNIPGY